MSRADARLRRDLDDLDRELESFASEAMPWTGRCPRCDRAIGRCRCRCDDCGRLYFAECTCRAEDFAAAPNPADPIMRPSVDHSLLSPSGRMSKRARAAAIERTRVELFGPQGLARPQAAQPSEREALLRQAHDLRDLADRGMKPRAYRREAERLESLAAALPEGNPSRRDRDFASRQTALPGLAETGFSLTPQQDALARRREIAREEREAARREAEFKARQAAMFGDDRGGE